MKSRSIAKTRTHEKCDFPYIKTPEDKHLVVLGLSKLKKKKTKTGVAGLGDDDSDQHDEYSFNDTVDDMDYDIVEAEPDYYNDNYDQI